MIFIFIPFELLLLLIFCLFVLGNSLYNSFLDALPSLLMAVGVVVFSILMIFMVRYFINKRRRCKLMYILGEIIVCLGLSVGVIVIGEIMSLDNCERLFVWFGTSPDMRILSYLGILSLLSFIFFVVAYLIPFDLISNIILILPIILPFLIYAKCLPISVDSYSDYVKTDFKSEETPLEFVITKDTPIYYPDVWKGNPLFPAISSTKYTIHEFQKGEIVYSPYRTDPDYELKPGGRITVSNGELSGIISTDDIVVVSEPQYKYEMQLRVPEADVYKARLINNKFYQKTDEVIGTVSISDFPNGILTVMQSENGFLRVVLPDGSIGYISVNDVKIKKTPLS